MKYAKWHPGQLALAWVAVLMIDSFLNRYFRYNADFEDQAHDRVALLVALIGIGITVALFTVTWKWFGSRDQKT